MYLFTQTWRRTAKITQNKYYLIALARMTGTINGVAVIRFEHTERSMVSGRRAVDDSRHAKAAVRCRRAGANRRGCVAGRGYVAGARGR